MFRTTASLIFTAASLVPSAAPAWGDSPPPIEAQRPEGWELRRKPAEAQKPLAPVPQLIERLGSPRFAERAMASRDLVRSGKAAVPALREAALAEHPEVSLRAVGALEDLWLRAMEREDEATQAEALAALDELSGVGDRALRMRVETLLSAYAPLIEKYALNEIRRLGGIVKFDDAIFHTNDDGTLQRQVQHVIIGRNWTGGEEGLRHLRRLRSARLPVYFIKGTNVGDDAIERFRTENADKVSVAIRGPAYLGVQSSSFPVQGINGCLVDGVQPNTPAAKAGVRQNDIFIEFHGQRVRSFDDLVEQIMQTEPGQTVDATVIRENERVELKITMEAWQP